MSLFDSNALSGGKSLEQQLVWRDKAFGEVSKRLGMAHARGANYDNKRLNAQLGAYKKQEDYLIKTLGILSKELNDLTMGWTQPNPLSTLPQHSADLSIAGVSPVITPPVSSSSTESERIETGTVNGRQDESVDLAINTLRVRMHLVEASLNRLEHIIRSLDLRITQNMVTNASHVRFVAKRSSKA